MSTHPEHPTRREVTTGDVIGFGTGFDTYWREKHEGRGGPGFRRTV